MRALPYAKALVARRAAGERPWLVVATMGNEADRKLMRMAAFDGDKGIARIWVPDDFPVADADVHWAVGLDVFVAPFCDHERSAQLMIAIWRARCATLWCRDGKTERDRFGQWHVNMSRITGSQARLLPPYRRGTMDFHTTHNYQLPLDHTFRARVAAARDLALMCADEPLFDDPLFSSERAKLLAA